MQSASDNCALLKLFVCELDHAIRQVLHRTTHSAAQYVAHRTALELAVSVLSARCLKKARR